MSQRIVELIDLCIFPNLLIFTGISPSGAALCLVRSANFRKEDSPAWTLPSRVASVGEIYNPDYSFKLQQHNRSRRGCPSILQNS